MLAYLADKANERLVDIDSLLGRRFNEFAPEMFGEIEPL